MTQRELVIVGSGGHAREMLDVVDAVNADHPLYDFIGFLDDEPGRQGLEIRGHPVLGGLMWLAGRRAQPMVVVGVGSSASRWRVVARLNELGACAATLVHPRAALTAHVRLGPGAVVTAHAVITNNVWLGEHVHVNIGATISHDCRLGSFSTVAPGARLAGNVSIGDGCELGIGSVAIQGVAVGEWSIVGAGAVVIGALPANVTAVGVPARVIKTRPVGWQRGGAQRAAPGGE